MPKALFVLTEKMLATSLTWPMDMLSSANQAAKRLCKTAEGFSLETVAVDTKPIICHGALPLAPQSKLREQHQADVIYLPALWRNPQTVIANNRALLPWLQQQCSQGAIIAGVGTGCCFLAAAGLLDHKPATTHWYYFDQFQQHYPTVRLKREHFITQAGNLYCAASINSLADLSIHFIQQFFNQATAQHVQRHFSHEVRRPYDAVSYLEDNNSNHPDEEIVQAQLWLQNNIAKPFSLSTTAEYFGMSTRNFSRRFKSAIGKTPIQYLHELRIKTAQELLQSSNLSISEIADRVGFQDLSYFAQVFRRSLSISPRDYRTSVRAKLFTSKPLLTTPIAKSH